MEFYQTIALFYNIYNLTNKKVTTDGDYAYNLDGRRLIVGLTKSF